MADIQRLRDEQRAAIEFFNRRRDPMTLTLGNIVATAGVDSWVKESPDARAKPLIESLRRHQSGDWGEVCDEDKSTNDAALTTDCRIISAYTIDDRKLWIITEWDRSVTTILFPEEY